MILIQEPVYYYTARIGDTTVLYQSHRGDLEQGDKIVHNYSTGARVELVIKYGFGTAFPAHLLTTAACSSRWPLIISAF